MLDFDYNNATENDRMMTGNKANELIHVYKRRYYILLLFVLLSGSNAMQWIEYSIIAHIIVDFYSVSYSIVDWTSMVFMLSYIILVLPASWVLDKYGLRVALLLGSGGNCIGAWIKILSCKPDAFWVTFLGQTVVGCSQMFILSIPPRLAAVWFGSNEVSTACSAGVFGNELGIGVGFLVPPLMVHLGTKESMSNDLSHLFLLSAIFNTAIFLLIVISLPKQPPLPPSEAQLHSIENVADKNYLESLKELLKNRNYVLLLITYGVNVGVFYAISTLLSQMILYYHPTEQKSTGTIGLLIVVAGMVGSVVCGFFLDKFHMYRLTTIVVYIFSAIGMLCFTFTVTLNDIWYIFLIASFLGFFMTGYLPVGFEFAAELTYPVPEGTSSGLLNGSAQVFGVLLTIGVGYLIQYNVFASNIVLSGFLVVGAALTALIKSDLRRQKAHKNLAYTISTTNSELQTGRSN